MSRSTSLPRSRKYSAIAVATNPARTRNTGDSWAVDTTIHTALQAGFAQVLANEIAHLAAAFAG